jgi:quercetin dioxygenase-like cupin family protein
MERARHCNARDAVWSPAWLVHSVVWFTGDVDVDTAAEPSEPYCLAAANVPFTTGACTAWHTHPLG